MRERAFRTAERLVPLAEWGGRRGRRVSGAGEWAFRGMGMECPVVGTGHSHRERTVPAVGEGVPEVRTELDG